MESLEEIRSKIVSLKKAHELMIYQQDLSFEVAPRDSRFSTSLLELMKREETVGRDPSSATSSAIISRVDDMLFTETQQFFAKVVNQNNKKWDTLRQNLTKEIQSMKKRIASRFRQEDIASATGVTNKMTISTPVNSISSSAESSRKEEKDLLAQEEERLLVDYYRNWHRYEMLHLQEAFSSQIARIDRDWSVHEQNLKKDYDEKREALAGKLPSVVQANAPTSETVSDHHLAKKWHHAEKQKALIHTAPVFAPNVAGSGRNVSATKRTAERGIASMTAELQRLDREYQVSLQQLQRQKADAKKWLHRQQLRLSAQCEEVHREKAAVSDLYESEFGEIRRMLEVVMKGIQALASVESSQKRNRGSMDSTNSSNEGDSHTGGRLPQNPTPLAVSLREPKSFSSNVNFVATS